MEDSLPQRDKYLLQLHSVQWIDSEARILQETVRAVLGTNSKLPGAEYEELVLRVGY